MINEDSKSELFHLKNISFSYGHYAAIQDLSLSINKGESIVLLGANGSGKSTLLKILGGLFFPQQGEVWAFKRLLSQKLLLHDPFSIYFRANVAILFQNSDVQLFNPSVIEEICFGPLQWQEDRKLVLKKAHEIMDKLGLLSLKERPPFALSGGEKRKVALASLLILEPEILLLDEPTTGLDPRSERLLLDALIQHRESGKTMIITTHNLHIVEEMATRVILFGENKNILADGHPHDILKNKQLLHKANLLHIHRHSHIQNNHIKWHEHEHDHSFDHDHPHKEES